MDGRENKEYTPGIVVVKTYDFFAENPVRDVENPGVTGGTVTSVGSGRFHQKAAKPEVGFSSKCPGFRRFSLVFVCFRRFSSFFAITN